MCNWKRRACWQIETTEEKSLIWSAPSCVQGSKVPFSFSQVQEDAFRTETRPHGPLFFNHIYPGAEGGGSGRFPWATIFLTLRALQEAPGFANPQGSPQARNRKAQMSALGLGMWSQYLKVLQSENLPYKPKRY